MFESIKHLEVIRYSKRSFNSPTIYDFEDKEGTKYYFYLMDGYAKIVLVDRYTILEGEMIGFKGVCDWTQVIEWAYINGLRIDY